VHECTRDIARNIATTDAYVTSRRQRKMVEMLFAHIKGILGVDRLRQRGRNGARDRLISSGTLRPQRAAAAPRM
jgi:hypothetical protein